MRRKVVYGLLGLAGLAGIFSLAGGCSSTYPRRNPLGETFPTVQGESLAGQKITLPDAVAGAPAVLLVGYKQQTQFDLDRWLLGMQQAGLDVKVYEVPTIPGLVPGLFASRIDEGMRRGIPREDWATVVTLYTDAKKIALFTGNENPMPGRVLVLDPQGKVVFFHDTGYSVGSLNRLKSAVQQAATTRPSNDQQLPTDR